MLKSKQAEGDKDESSGSEGEEDWERGERLHENVFEQDRIKDRLFEEEVELVWEKGSSGLVFYCDSALWDEAKGDFDERTTDDLDVDMSLYWKGQGSLKILIALLKFMSLKEEYGDNFKCTMVPNGYEHPKKFE